MYKGKVALIFGGASGIGKALSESMASRGAIVAIADINYEVAEKLANQLRLKGVSTIALQADVSKSDQITNVINTVIKKYGRIDFLFNSAGIAIAGEAYKMSQEQWEKIIDINLWGTIYAASEVYKIMVQQKSGYIINIASGAGLFPNPMKTAYSTTKYGVVGFSTSLRSEAEVYGIQVNVVCPGPVRTPILDKIEVLAEKSVNKKEVIDKNKWMEPEKAAELILRGVEKNKSIIAITFIAKALWKFYSFMPTLYEKTFARKIVKRYIKLLK